MQACHAALTETTRNCRVRRDCRLPPYAAYPACRSTKHRSVVAGRFAFTLLAYDLGVHHPGGQRRRAEDEVDAHALFLREPQLRVIPVGVNPGPGVKGRTTSVNCASTMALNALRSGSETCVQPAKNSVLQTSSSVGAMFPVAHQCDCAAGSSRSQPSAVSRSAASQSNL